MRFIARTIWGGLIVAACALALWFGVSSYSEARQSGDTDRPRRAAPERVYTVRDVVIEPITASPILRVFGEVEAWRVLDLRTALAGRIVDIAPQMREGVRVSAGTVLARIDAADVRSQEQDTLTVLADARSEQAQAEQSLALSRADLEAALRQRTLRRSALERQQNLATRGVVAATSVESSQLELSSAEQAVASRRTAYIAAKQRVSQAATAIRRAELDVESVRRDNEETAVLAPFDGLLSEVSATLGSRVTQTETLARLIDMNSLEVAFRVSDAEYARLLNADGSLAPLDATVTLNLGERAVDARAVLDRPAATVAEEGGRTVYAQIRTEAQTPMRPGDFVSVAIEEPPLDQVAEIPARAATEDGRVFVIGEDGRLSEERVRILRRQSQSLIVTDIPFGSRIVAERRPQLGEGIKVQSPEEAAAAEAEKSESKGKGRGGRGGGRPRS
jgi:multidrug efflux pump subunit AcrA (membrane-fusion protein)